MLDWLFETIVPDKMMIGQLLRHLASGQVTAKDEM